MLAEASTLANTRNLNWENKETVQLDANPSIHNLIIAQKISLTTFSWTGHIGDLQVHGEITRLFTDIDNTNSVLKVEQPCR